MSCELQIVLDKKDATYYGGETITGTLHVSAKQVIKCKALFIDLLWQTSGWGYTDKHEETKINIFSGTIEPGEHDFPFEVEAPKKPVTYSGELFQINWSLQAIADISRKIKPKTTTNVIIYNIDKIELNADARNLQLYTKPMARTSLLKGIIAGILFVVFGLSMYSTTLFDQQPNNVFADFIFLLMFASIGVVITWLYIYRLVAERRLGPVRFQVLNPDELVDKEVQCILSFEPKSNVDINSISICLEGVEISSRGTGQKSPHKRHSLYDKTLTIHEKGILQKNKLYFSTHSFLMPDDAAPTFSARNNRVTWTLTARIDIPRWPDWDHRIPLHVHPSKEKLKPTATS